jgi:hypothetical protein
MHDPTGLLEIAAFVGGLLNSTGGRPCSSAELACMKINGATLLAAYVHAMSNQLAVTSSACSLSEASRRLKPKGNTMSLIPLKTGLAALALGLVLTASASQGFAQERGIHVSAARAAAIQECNARSSKYLEYVWGDTEIQVYRECMAEHHQME